MDRRKFFKSLIGLIGVAFFGGKLVSEVPPVEDPTQLLLHYMSDGDSWYMFPPPSAVLVPKHMEETARKMING